MKMPNPLVGDLLEVAELLAKQTGRANLRQAAMRRAISTAYYAVFHALCYVCADGLVRWSRADLVARVYRSLDHGQARRRLAVIAAQPRTPDSLRRLGFAFGELQDKRHRADYEAPSRLFTQKQALAEIERAREMIDVIGQLDERQRRDLAVDLVLAKPR